MPVKYTHEEDNAELKRGNLCVNTQSKFVEVVCASWQVPIPSRLEVSLLAAKSTDIIRVKDVKLPPGVALSKKADPESVIAVFSSG